MSRNRLADIVRDAEASDMTPAEVIESEAPAPLPPPADAPPADAPPADAQPAEQAAGEGGP